MKTYKKLTTISVHGQDFKMNQSKIKLKAIK